MQCHPKSHVLKEAEEVMQDLEEYHVRPFDLENILMLIETNTNLMGPDLGFESHPSFDYGALFSLEKTMNLLENPPEKIASKSKSIANIPSLKKLLSSLSEIHIPCSFILLNLDHFRQINSGFGFPTGDMLLNLLNQRILRSMRATDHIVYLGKDEFLFFLPHTSLTGGRIVAERLRSLVKSISLTIGLQRIGCTASLGGITIKQSSPLSFENIYPSLRKELLNAKGRGRNRVSWLLERS